jgi:hypothetical protein
MGGLSLADAHCSASCSQTPIRNATSERRCVGSSGSSTSGWRHSPNYLDTAIDPSASYPGLGELLILRLVSPQLLGAVLSLRAAPVLKERSRRQPELVLRSERLGSSPSGQKVWLIAAVHPVVAVQYPPNTETGRRWLLRRCRRPAYACVSQAVTRTSPYARHTAPVLRPRACVTSSSSRSCAESCTAIRRWRSSGRRSGACTGRRSRPTSGPRLSPASPSSATGWRCGCSWTTAYAKARCSACSSSTLTTRASG